MMETAQHICGMSKGPCRHKERWWNEVVAEAVREKKIKYRKWKRENSKEAWIRMEYKKCRRVQRWLFPRQRKRNNVQVI